MTGDVLPICYLDGFNLDVFLTVRYDLQSRRSVITEIHPCDRQLSAQAVGKLFWVSEVPKKRV